MTDRSCVRCEFVVRDETLDWCPQCETHLPPVRDESFQDAQIARPPDARIEVAPEERGPLVYERSWEPAERLIYRKEPEPLPPPPPPGPNWWAIAGVVALVLLVTVIIVVAIAVGFDTS